MCFVLQLQSESIFIAHKTFQRREGRGGSIVFWQLLTLLCSLLLMGLQSREMGMEKGITPPSLSLLSIHLPNSCHSGNY